jgi:hypothetical protein
MGNAFIAISIANESWTIANSLESKRIVTKVHGRNEYCYETGDVMQTGKWGLPAWTTVSVTKHFTSALQG